LELAEEAGLDLLPICLAVVEKAAEGVLDSVLDDLSQHPLGVDYFQPGLVDVFSSSENENQV